MSEAVYLKLVNSKFMFCIHYIISRIAEKQNRGPAVTVTLVWCSTYFNSRICTTQENTVKTDGLYAVVKTIKVNYFSLLSKSKIR